MRTAEEIEVEAGGIPWVAIEAVLGAHFGDRVVTGVFAMRDELRERDAADRAKRERWSGTADYTAKQPRTICDQCGALIGFKTMYFRRPGVGAKHETCCYQCAQRLKQGLIDASGVSVDAITQAHLDWINKAARFPFTSMSIEHMDIGVVQAALERIRIAATHTPDAAAS